jgi:hypothetical protein
MTVLTLQPSGSLGIDAEISDATPTTPAGSGTTLTIGNVNPIGTDSLYRALLRFDLTAIPDGALISSAVLTLYDVAGGAMSATRTFNAYRLTQTSWVEATATWNNYATALPWTTAGGDYTTTNGDSVSVSSATADVVFSSLADLAMDALYNRSGLLHLVIKGTEGTGADDYVAVGSSDNATAGLRPQLVVTYSESIHYLCAQAIQTSIKALDLPLLNDDQVLVQKLPWYRAETLPACVVSTWQQEAVPLNSGTNLRDDISYPVQVSFVQAGNQSLTTHHALLLMWRQQAMRNFRNQRLSVECVWTCRIQPATVFMPAEFQRNLDHSSFTVACINREYRGALGVI